MNFIKINNNDDVLIGGQVATNEMILDGWVKYEGIIPNGNYFKLVGDVLESYIPEKNHLQLYHEDLDLLKSTDHKFYVGYEPKIGENLEELQLRRSTARSNVRSYITKVTIITDQNM